MAKTPFRTVNYVNYVLAVMGCLWLAVSLQCILKCALRDTLVLKLFFPPFPEFYGRGFNLPWGIAQCVNGIAWLNIWIRGAAVAIMGLKSELFISVVLGPALEEMICRGPFWALSRYAKKWWWIASGVVMCLFFAFGHNAGLGQMIPIFMVGMTGMWLIQKTGRLWPAILCHALYNLGVIMLAMAAQSMPSW